MQKKTSNDFPLDTNITDDLFEEAIRSVEKHVIPTKTKQHIEDLSEYVENDPHFNTKNDGNEDDGLDDLLDIEALDDSSQLWKSRNKAVSKKIKTFKPEPPKEEAPTFEKEMIIRLKDRVSSLERDVKYLTQELENKTTENQRLLDRSNRAVNELDVIKKKMLREKQSIEKFALDNAFKELLPVLDNIDRAMAHLVSNPSIDPQSIIDGVKITHTQLNKYLQRFGVTKINASPGSEFDPSLHEAMMQEPSDMFPINSISKELQSGYLIQDRLLRASLVSVVSYSTAKEVSNGNSLEKVDNNGNSEEFSNKEENHTQEVHQIETQQEHHKINLLDLVKDQEIKQKTKPLHKVEGKSNPIGVTKLSQAEENSDKIATENYEENHEEDHHRKITNLADQDND